MSLVLHVLGPSAGGIREHVRALVRLLPSHGFDSVVAGPDPSVATHALPLSNARECAVAVPRLAAIVRRTRPAVVHAQGLKAGLVAGLSARRVPLVVTIHNEPSSIGALVPRLADAVLAVSSELAARIGSRARVVPLAVPRRSPARDRDAVRAELGDGPAVLTVARLEPQKDLATLVQASALVGGPVRWWVAGVGPERVALETLAGDRVDFLGWRDDVPDLLGAADVFALSSVWEGVPFALVEAAAAELPIVATRVGGIPEILADGETAWLVAPRDPHALAAAVVDALGHPDEARRRAAAARERLASRLDQDAMVREIAAVYRALTAVG